VRILFAVSLVIAVCGAQLALAAEAAGTPLRRTILALYDSRAEKEPRLTRIHRYAETPLNHLGLTVIYHDIQRELPRVETLPDVRGVLSWLSGPVREPQVAYLQWAKTVVDQDRFFVILGDPGFGMEIGTPAEPELATKFTSRLGFVGSGKYSPGPYGIEIIRKVASMVEYERLLSGPLPGYLRFRSVGDQTKIYLSVRLGDDAESESDLVLVGERGGMAASGYELYSDPWLGYAQWRIDPFAFFRAAFRTDELPKPDSSTLAGRRLFYAHVDGDGWRELTRIPGYKTKVALCAEVVFDTILRRYPYTPITVAPIVADLDDRWRGGKQARAIAERIFSLPNVEAGSHTVSHPFLWALFREPADAASAETGVATGEGQSDGDGAATQTSWSERARQLIELGDTMPPPYRAYSEAPFDLAAEIGGSIQVLNDLLPPGKRVAVFKWSGDTHPFEEALAAVDAAGIPNINGGSNGFVQPYPSVTSASPVGLRVGRYFQVYAGNADERSYTNRHPDHVPGSYHFTSILQRTETPRRIRPFEVYWHMYSALHYSSLSGVISQLDLAQNLDLVPIPTSIYARIAGGFVTTRLSKVGDRAWRVEDRSDLATIRFDDAVFSTVDFGASRGVVGQRHHQGSLYVYLDASDPAPVVALRDNETSGAPAEAPRPYLVQSRWPIRDLAIDKTGFEFASQGFGAGDMLWHVAEPGEYAIVSRSDAGAAWRATALVAKDRLLRLMPPAEASWSRIRIEKRPTEEAAKP
jgi:polysaccharide biosynthesis protein PelA